MIILHRRNKNHDHMLPISSDMEHDKCNCYFSFWAILCTFTTPKNQNFEKLKTNPGDIIILHKSTKNQDQLLYCTAL